MDFQSTVEKWRRVDMERSGSLAGARLAAHWAAQVVAAVGDALVPAESDDSHTSMEWDDGRGLLLGGPIPGGGVRVGLSLAGLELVVLDGRQAERQRIPLEERTLTAALDLVTEVLAGLLGHPVERRPELRTYDMPAHPVGQGVPFAAPDRQGLAELARWYGNAAALMETVSDATPLASPVRCWPHHFDITTLLTLDPEEAGDDRRYIGFGLSPGDASYGEPYFYVNPWPYPGDGELPELAGGGFWHREGWTGAVLPASRLTPDGAAQGERVVAWLRSALAAVREQLERPGDVVWDELGFTGRGERGARP